MIELPRYQDTSWYECSYSWIAEQERENPSLSKADLKKYCSQNYPWQMRRGAAYKGWLKAMREFFGARIQNQTMADMFEETA